MKILNIKSLNKVLFLFFAFMFSEIISIHHAHGASDEAVKPQFYIAYFHGLGGAPDGVSALFARKQAEIRVPQNFFASYFPQAPGGSWFDIVVPDLNLGAHLSQETLLAYVSDPLGNKDTIAGRIMSNIQAAAKTQLAHIETEMRRLGIPERHLILSGESQGGLLAWAIAYERRNNPAGTLGIATTSAPPLWLSVERTIPEFAVVALNSDDPVFPANIFFPFVSHVKGFYPDGKFTHISPGGGHVPPQAFYEKSMELLSLIVPKPAGA